MATGKFSGLRLCALKSCRMRFKCSRPRETEFRAKLVGGGLRRAARRRRRRIGVVMAVEHDANQVRIKFFQLVVGAVVGERGSPVLKQAANGPVSRRIVGRRNALLEQEPRDQRNIECGIAGVLARYDRARRRIVDSRQDGPLCATEVAWVIVQNAWQKSVHKKCGCHLVGLGGPEAFCEWTPALSIVWLRVRGLLESGLKQVAQVGAEINGLMKLEGEFLFYGQRLLIGRVVVFRLKIGNDSEDALRIVILLARGIGWGAALLLLRGVRLLRSVGSQIGIGCDLGGGSCGFCGDDLGFGRGSFGSNR